MPGTQVCGNVIGDEDDDETAAEREGNEVLPFTGAALGSVVVAGLILIAGGVIAIRRAK